MTAITAWYLCGGPREAQAAQRQRATDARRAQALAALKIDAQMLDAPDAWRAAEAARVKLKRAAAMKRARELAHADQAEAKAKAAKQVAAELEAKAEPQRLVRKLRQATVEGKRGDALKTALFAEAPALRNVKAPAQAVAPPRIDDRKPLKPRAVKPRLKGATGALTPELQQLYASVEGSGASVLEPDGELRPVEDVLYGLRPRRAPRAVASIASDVGFSLFGALPAPTADDLAETAETARTPELLAVLQQTGSSPLALYNRVHTSIAPQLYWGSKKGAAATLREGAGNDFDQSSLLVALLRAAGVPARYEHGIVRLSLAQAQALTGADTIEHAAYLIGYTGAPTSVDGNTILTERVWVRAWVSYGDYKGTGPGGESLWVRLDPGMKLTSWKHAVSLRGVASFDSAAYLSAPSSKTPQEVFEAQLLAAAKAKSLCNNLNDALAAPTVTEKPLQLMPSEHPAKLEQSLLVFSRVPTSLQWTVDVSLESGSKSFTLAELQYHRLSLRYVGSTPADVAAIAAAGGLANIAPFRVRVAGTLRLDGVEVKRFDDGLPGVSQLLTVRITGPGVAPASVNHQLRAGGVYAIALYGGIADSAWADSLKSAVTTSPSEDNAEAAGHAAAALYAAQQQASATRLFGLQGHGVFQDVLESIAGRELNVTEAFGVPVTVTPGLYILDVGHDTLTPVPMDGDASLVSALNLLSGFQGSTLEARAWEQLFARRAIASVPVIAQAPSLGVPVLTLNGGSATGLTGYSASSLLEINQALAAGWRATLPQRPVTLSGYVNVEAFILFDPVTGSGTYRIGHANGGGSDGPGTGGGDPSNCPTCSRNDHPVSSMVNLANGRLTESYTDLTLPSVGLPVVFSRHYASDFKQTTALGVGWLHSYAIFLRTELNGDITFVTEDTTEVRFVKTGSTFAVPVGWYFTLTPISGGLRVRAKEGFVWEFDTSGRLTRLVDNSGNSTTMVYSGSQLTSVLDSSAATALTLAYTAGKLTSVTDRAGRVVGYGFTGDDLTSATDVVQNTETYGYDARHLLTSRTDKRGQTQQIAFDAFGR
ncbi:MAG: hypothetical protein IPJ65_28135 [Archangiaceae bacterium]|nr:hypothetical protein [Archangiaceae bacterium]